MKINDPGIPGGPAGLPGGDNNISNAQKANRSAALLKLGHSGAYGRASDASPAGSDEVTISPLAQALRSARSDSPERQARLDAIAKQVDGGTYRVDSAALSGSLVQHAFSQNDPGQSEPSPVTSGGAAVSS